MSGRKGTTGQGRPRTPTSVLKLHGTFRADRHGDREARADGELKKPRGLGKHGSQFWDRAAKWLTNNGVAGEFDTDALAACCRWYEAYMTAETFDQRDKAYKNWDRLAARFGYTPSDRARLSVKPAATTPAIQSRKRG